MCTSVPIIVRGSVVCGLWSVVCGPWSVVRGPWSAGYRSVSGSAGPQVRWSAGRQVRADGHRIPAMLARVSGVLLILLGLFQAPPMSPPPQEWRVTGGDPGATRHSPLMQIAKDTVARLEQAWAFDTGATNLQVTPIVAGGVMYL